MFFQMSYPVPDPLPFWQWAHKIFPVFDSRNNFFQTNPLHRRRMCPLLGCFMPARDCKNWRCPEPSIPAKPDHFACIQVKIDILNSNTEVFNIQVFEQINRHPVCAGMRGTCTCDLSSKHQFDQIVFIKWRFPFTNQAALTQHHRPAA